MRGTHVHGDATTPAKEVLAAYEWSAGKCFRCAGPDVPTALVGVLHQRRGTVGIRGCEPCVLAMERARERAAQRYGWPYVPGTPVLIESSDHVGNP
jgi:hypothetical protein